MEGERDSTSLSPCVRTRRPSQPGFDLKPLVAARPTSRARVAAAERPARAQGPLAFARRAIERHEGRRFAQRVLDLREGEGRCAGDLGEGGLALELERERLPYACQPAAVLVDVNRDANRVRLIPDRPA